LTAHKDLLTKHSLKYPAQQFSLFLNLFVNKAGYVIM